MVLRANGDFDPLTPRVRGPRRAGSEDDTFIGGENFGRHNGTTSRQKTAPVFDGGQVALVLSCCESLVGGQTAGEPSVPERASGVATRLLAAPHR
jgi:hypothetical protein